MTEEERDAAFDEAWEAWEAWGRAYEEWQAENARRWGAWHQRVAERVLEIAKEDASEDKKS
jgi:hypothetical protein